MRWFKNLKVRTKLILGFGIVSLFIVAVGILSLVSLNTINQRGNKMYSDNFIPSTQLATVQQNMLQIRSNILLLIYEKSADQLKTRIDEITKWSDENAQILEKYQKTIVDPEEKKIYDSMNATDIPLYRDRRTEMIQLLQAGKTEEATAKLPELTKARVKVEDGFTQLIQLNEKAAEKDNQENRDEFDQQFVLMLVIVIFGILLAMLLGWVISSIINKPLVRLVEAAGKIAGGDLNVSLEADSRDEMGALTEAFKSMSDNVNEVLVNISSASEQVATGSKQMSESSMVLSQGATEQASTVEELTASLEEIAAQTKQNASNAGEANRIAESAKAGAMEGNDKMKEMLKAMEEINSASGNISKIIKVIDEIAFQTNILALNAAVEAARAGQHGKGFAVVAEEVRNLAARSASAAKETTAMIEGSIQKVEDGTNIAKVTAGALDRIVDGVADVARLVNEIATASNEQASGISQINQGVMQVSQVIQTSSATSEETAAASEELASQAELLRELVGRFKLKKGAVMGKRLNELDPEVLKMLENLADRKKVPGVGVKLKETMSQPKTKINLTDGEFGKY